MKYIILLIVTTITFNLNQCLSQKIDWEYEFEIDVRASTNFIVFDEADNLLISTYYSKKNQKSRRSILKLDKKGNTINQLSVEGRTGRIVPFNNDLLSIGVGHEYNTKKKVEIFSWNKNLLSEHDDPVIENSFGKSLECYAKAKDKYHVILDYDWDTYELTTATIDSAKNIRSSITKIEGTELGGFVPTPNDFRILENGDYLITFSYGREIAPDMIADYCGGVTVCMASGKTKWVYSNSTIKHQDVHLSVSKDYISLGYTFNKSVGVSKFLDLLNHDGQLVKTLELKIIEDRLIDFEITDDSIVALGKKKIYWLNFDGKIVHSERIKSRKHGQPNKLLKNATNSIFLHTKNNGRFKILKLKGRKKGK